MKRSPLRRKKGLSRKTRVRARNPERAARLRAVQFGPQAALCHALPCSVPTCRTGLPSDAAHVRSRGAGGKDRANVVPLCRIHHDEQGRVGILTFQERHGIDLALIAARLSVAAGYDPPEHKEAP